MNSNFFSDFDHLNVGCNGFAQVGSENYPKKANTEMGILLEFLKNNHPVPLEFANIAWYSVKTFPHDFGSYKEIVVMYNRYEIECLTDDPDDEEKTNKYDRFFEWFNSVEAVDLEADDLTEKIKAAYLKVINLYTAEHLEIKRDNLNRKIS